MPRLKPKTIRVFSYVPRSPLGFGTVRRLSKLHRKGELGRFTGEPKGPEAEVRVEFQVGYQGKIIKKSVRAVDLSALVKLKKAMGLGSEDELIKLVKKTSPKGLGVIANKVPGNFELWEREAILNELIKLKGIIGKQARSPSESTMKRLFSSIAPGNITRKTTTRMVRGKPQKVTSYIYYKRKRRT